MTAPRGKIEASLAERGRPAQWANESEAASLSGLSPDKYREKLDELEKAGFPRINLWNGKRFIPAIINFWAAQVDSALPTEPESKDQDNDGPEVENFHGKAQRQLAG